MSKRPKYIVLIFIFSILTIDSFSQSIYLETVGASSEETKVIDSIGYKNNFKDYKSLDTELNALTLKLQYSGYLEAIISETSKLNDSTYLASFSIGKRYKKISVSISDDFDTSLLKDLPLDINNNSIEIKISDLEFVLSTLNKRLSDQGDPFSTIQLTNISKRSSTDINADLKTVSNSKRRIDSIIIKGYEKFPKSFVRRFLKINKGNTFSIEDINTKAEGLGSLVFANQIKDPEVLFTRDSTILYMYIEKTKSNSFDGFLGFGTNEETNKLEFDGYLNLILTNNLNFGESLKLLYKSDENEQRTFDVKANLPYLFGSPIDVDLGLNIFRKDSTFLTTTQIVRLGYNINQNNKIGLGIDAINSSNLLENTTTTLDDFNSNFYNLYYDYIKPQRYDKLFPINTTINFSIGIGNRTLQNTEFNQNRVTFSGFKIFNLNDRNSIYTKISGAYLESDNYLENELFRFGGINSIRGFEENSLIANLFSVLNTEYRYKVSNTLYVHSVVDASYSENDIINSKTKLFGFGFGFGLLTNAGLFRFNYASAKTENQRFSLSDSKIHISLTAQF
ncbi:hypothetical protein RM697_07040 [Ichthyenterobacterium sp. W332]|uniref:POTRA domain-containing protein n=1 Tax=Microcosmobacter mediterraneus TaxID=3075607 RepID=A0ABU2YJQ3_9FLAO|nr:POTRA domain-containing protein [Ichthyenterobacterium sp. W332]MDT0558394.1 hypothetical protein [Ichthyenterobacterium sp. W332]